MIPLSDLKSKNQENPSHDCCAPKGNDSGKASTQPTQGNSICKTCGVKGAAVPAKTLRFHLKAPWNHPLPYLYYHFCGNPHCQVIYFDEKGVPLNKDKIKESSHFFAPNPTLCHCFNITQSDIQNQAEPGTLKNYVIEQTKQKNCACEIKNPSGKCCLANFPT